MKWLLSSAILLAIGMVAAGVTAGRTLRERDAAVREGVLLRAAHGAERSLREGGPESVDETVDELVSSAKASAAELYAGERLIHRAGVPLGRPVDTPLFLGPAWRNLAGRGDGQGRGMVAGRTGPPFQLRLWPAAGAGDSSRIAALTSWGSVAAAAALLVFALNAAWGIEARQRTAFLDAERQRLEIVSLAGAGLAHRIRNPLATIKATAQLLEVRGTDVERDRATRIVEASVRIEALVDELLTFARPVEVHPESVDLAEAARATFPAVNGDFPAVARADREHVLAAIEELATNAKQAGDPNPEVVVRRQGRHVGIEVRDRGAGLSLDAERAFHPYVTTRPDGTGLGLPTIRALIRANGGDVALAAREGGGCVATLWLPAVES